MELQEVSTGLLSQSIRRKQIALRALKSASKKSKKIPSKLKSKLKTIKQLAKKMKKKEQNLRNIRSKALRAEGYIAQDKVKTDLPPEVDVRKHIILKKFIKKNDMPPEEASVEIIKKKPKGTQDILRTIHVEHALRAKLREWIQDNY